MEDSSQESFRTYNSSFCIRVAVMVFLNPKTWKEYNKKEHKEQSPIPFLLQTSFSLSYLLHNSMSKSLFGKALKCKNEINKKKE